MFDNITMSDLLVGIGNGKTRVKRWDDKKPKRIVKVKCKEDDKKNTRK